jgi:FkbM family methyltransferase
VRTFRALAAAVLPEAIKAPLRFHLQSWGVQTPIEEAIALRFAHQKFGFFVQIGSNDGVRGDPLNKFLMKNRGWHGILVEPVPYLFKRLKANYRKNARFTFVNAAVSDTKGTRPFYYVEEMAAARLARLPSMPWWTDQVGSFDRGHIISALGAAVEPYIICENVPCLTLAELIADGPALDILHIDAEGADYMILSQVRFELCPPTIIIYEHQHFNVDQSAAASRILQENGYILNRYYPDTIAVRGEISPSHGVPTDAHLRRVRDGVHNA